MHLGRLVLPVDGDLPLEGIDQARKLRSIRNPLLHLLFEFGKAMAGRAQVDDEVRAERRIPRLVRIAKRLPPRKRNLGSIGSTHGAVRQRKSAVGIEGNATAVCFGPFIQQSPNTHIHFAGLASCGCHHEDLSIGITLDTKSVIGSAEAHQLFVGHRHLRAEANRKRKLC